MSEEIPPPTVSALLDAGSTPTEAKKPKLFHVDPSDSTSRTSESPVASSSSASARSSELHPGPVKPDEIDGSTSPVVMAVSLPTDEGLDEKEEWWELKMTWSGKVYHMTVGSNDM